MVDLAECLSEKIRIVRQRTGERAFRDEPPVQCRVDRCNGECEVLTVEALNECVSQWFRRCDPRAWLLSPVQAHVARQFVSEVQLRGVWVPQSARVTRNGYVQLLVVDYL
jgi:hypothetical protein